jgi:hypothetical protein
LISRAFVALSLPWADSFSRHKTICLIMLFL